MKRFNQGFRWFGPMEQCSDGKYVLTDEVESELNAVEVELNDCLIKIESMVGIAKDWRENYFNQVMKTRFWMGLALIFFGISLIELSMLMDRL
jgi:hypothetical protein